MNILMLAMGSRGDVQPYVALGRGLVQAGHQVCLVTFKNFEKLATDHGLAIWPIDVDIEAFIQKPGTKDEIVGGNVLRSMRELATEAKRVGVMVGEQALEASDGMDMIVVGLSGVFMGAALSEKTGIPLVQAYSLPFYPTRTYPGLLLPSAGDWFGGCLNRFSHHLTRQIMWQTSRMADMATRKQVFKLPAAPFFGPFNAPVMQRNPTLFGISSVIFPFPNDWDPTKIHITGDWLLPHSTDWQPPDSLTDFLDAGSAPVYVGFGSMVSQNPEEMVRIVLEALERTGQRGVISAGWGGLAKRNVPDSVMMVDSIPHDWLFPRMRAVVHHGGAGTTAAGLRAGVPTVIVPFLGDQPFWGRFVEKIGVGTAPIASKKLTVDVLATRIERAVTDKAMRKKAAGLGAKIQAEDGVARAVQFIEQLRV